MHQSCFPQVPRGNSRSPGERGKAGYRSELTSTRIFPTEGVLTNCDRVLDA